MANWGTQRRVCKFVWEHTKLMGNDRKENSHGSSGMREGSSVSP